MPAFESTTHRAEVSADGILDVFPLEKRKIKEMSFTEDTVDIVEHTSESDNVVFRNILAAMDDFPVFRAAKHTDSEYHVDYEYSTQRWHGKRPTNDVVKALQRCNFSKNVVDKIISLCDETEHPFLPRVG